MSLRNWVAQVLRTRLQIRSQKLIDAVVESVKRDPYLYAVWLRSQRRSAD